MCRLIKKKEGLGKSRRLTEKVCLLEILYTSSSPYLAVLSLIFQGSVVYTPIFNHPFHFCECSWSLKYRKKNDESVRNNNTHNFPQNAVTCSVTFFQLKTKTNPNLKKYQKSFFFFNKYLQMQWIKTQRHLKIYNVIPQ